MQAPQATVKVNPGTPGVAGQAAPQPQQAGNPMQGASPQGARAAQGLANGQAPGPAAPAVTVLPNGQQAVGGTATLGPAPANQGNGNAGGVIGTVTITTSVNGGNANAGAGGAANAGNGKPATVTINQGGQGNQGNGAANQPAAGGVAATVTVKPGGQGNQGNGAANQPAAGGVAATVTIKPGVAGATPAAAPQGVAGAQAANACQCMCACPAGAFGGIAGMPGIMGSMNPPPAAAQPTTLVTSASAAPGMCISHRLTESRMRLTNSNFCRSEPACGSKCRSTSSSSSPSRPSSTTARSTRPTSCRPASRRTTTTRNNDRSYRTSSRQRASRQRTSRRRHSQWGINSTLAEFSHCAPFGQDVSYWACRGGRGDVAMSEGASDTSFDVWMDSTKDVCTSKDDERNGKCNNNGIYVSGMYVVSLQKEGYVIRRSSSFLGINMASDGIFFLKIVAIFCSILFQVLCVVLGFFTS